MQQSRVQPAEKRDSKRIVCRFIADSRGATAIEYAFIASLIGLAIVTSLSAISTDLNGVFTNVQTKL